jgi:hypothetical protein
MCLERETSSWIELRLDGESDEREGIAGRGDGKAGAECEMGESGGVVEESAGGGGCGALRGEEGSSSICTMELEHDIQVQDEAWFWHELTGDAGGVSANMESRFLGRSGDMG